MKVKGEGKGKEKRGRKGREGKGKEGRGRGKEGRVHPQCSLAIDATVYKAENAEYILLCNWLQ